MSDYNIEYTVTCYGKRFVNRKHIKAHMAKAVAGFFTILHENDNAFP